MNSRATEVAPGSNPLDPIRTLCLGDAGTAVANLQQMSGLIPHKAQKNSFGAKRLLRSSQTCRERRRFVASRCLRATVEATTGSPVGVRLYCVSVRNEEPFFPSPSPRQRSTAQHATLPPCAHST